ncbi:outer membrane beta-barrel protein [Flavobacterium orientale]|uniref:Outer membrane protein beta-barrel domain-containing protein n=1 Tax=Flavobacterium orientale TaxID=1756020 RepID=A0A916XYX4_9FLAO|nr:outer membrane beta-barrel protein [Flavobacterium orientale]GGD23101.1 hypothetical protein GCM10011343_11610 [Flavobacterium orientale]
MEKKNIDRLFQEKLKDFEAVPNVDIWNDIASELDSNQKRKVIPIWWKLAGVAALLLGGLLIIPFSTEEEKTPIVIDTNNILKEDENSKNTEVVLGGPSESEINQDLIKEEQSKEINQKNNPNSITNQNSLTTVNKEQIERQYTTEPNQTNNKKTVTNPSSLTTVIVDQQTQNAKTHQTNGSITKNLNSNSKTSNSNIAKTDKPNDTQLTNKNYLSSVDLKEKKSNPEENSSEQIISEKNDNSTANLIKRTELETKKQNISSSKEEEKELDSAIVLQETEATTLEELLKEKEENFSKEPKVNRWQIGPLVAPVYFNSVSNGSPIDAEFASNAKDYQNDMAYGIGLQYSISPKVSLRTGISKVNLGYNTNDIVFYAELNSNMLRTINYTNQGNPIVVHASNTPVFVENAIQEKNQGYMNQRMGFIEMPVELSYKILDKKIGINFIGGASTLLLTDNEVSLYSNDGFSGSLGEANNINNIHFSANFGVGFEYKFWKNFQANFEPMFKYQLNTFNNNPGNFKPYFIGLYTGINYRF